MSFSEISGARPTENEVRSFFVDNHNDSLDGWFMGDVTDETPAEAQTDPAYLE